MQQNDLLTSTSQIVEKWEYCFSVGKTRISGDQWECRMWPHGQEDRRKTIISVKDTVEEAVKHAIEELKLIKRTPENFPRRS